MTDARILAPARLQRLGAAVLMALLAAFVIFLLTADGVASISGGRLGGDWPAFYAAGELARSDVRLLLDLDAQRAAQAPYLPDGFLPFPYPPLFAYVLVPFSLLPFTASYIAFTAVLAATAGFAAVRVLDVLGVSDPGWRRVGWLGSVTFAPVFHAIGGAQNSTVTLLILAGVATLFARNRQLLAGCVLALLWFKPQFAIPVIGMLLVSGRWWRTGATAMAIAAPLWLISAALLGRDWVSVWLTEIVAFTDEGNRQFNLAGVISPVAWLRGALDASGGDVIAVLVALVIGLSFAVALRRSPTSSRFLALAGAALLVTALHALAYELVLLVPVIGYGLVSQRRSLVVGCLAYLGAWAAVLWAQPLLRVGYTLAVVAWALIPVTLVDRVRSTRRQSVRRRVSP